MDQWTYVNVVSLELIAPGKHMQNGHNEGFKGKFRDECLNQNWFATLRYAKRDGSLRTGDVITTRCARTPPWRICRQQSRAETSSMKAAEKLAER